MQPQVPLLLPHDPKAKQEEDEHVRLGHQLQTGVAALAEQGHQATDGGGQ